jgi:hypothetical protein
MIGEHPLYAKIDNSAQEISVECQEQRSRIMTEPTRISSGPNGRVPNDIPAPEVEPCVSRRRFSAAYKRWIVVEAVYESAANGKPVMLPAEPA